MKNMNILYCCKIINDTNLKEELVKKRRFKNSSFISRPYKNIELNNIDKFIESIESIININFNNAFFYINLEDIKSEKEIKIIIKEKLSKINARNKIIQFERPEEKEKWIYFIEKLITSYGDDYYLINMNHDHKLIGDIDVLCNVIEFIGSENIDNAIVAYTHNEELFAKCIIKEKNR